MAVVHVPECLRYLQCAAASFMGTLDPASRVACLIGDDAAELLLYKPRAIRGIALGCEYASFLQEAAATYDRMIVLTTSLISFPSQAWPHDWHPRLLASCGSSEELVDCFLSEVCLIYGWLMMASVCNDGGMVGSVKAAGVQTCCL